jgi:hypothetical protein
LGDNYEHLFDKILSNDIIVNKNTKEGEFCVLTREYLLYNSINYEMEYATIYNIVYGYINGVGRKNFNKDFTIKYLKNVFSNCDGDINCNIATHISLTILRNIIPSQHKQSLDRDIYDLEKGKKLLMTYLVAEINIEFENVFKIFNIKNMLSYTYDTHSVHSFIFKLLKLIEILGCGTIFTTCVITSAPDKLSQKLNKNSFLEIKIKTKLPMLLCLKILFNKPILLKNNIYSIYVSSLFLHNSSTETIPLDRKKSTYSNEFYQSLDFLSETRLYVDKYLFNSQMSLCKEILIKLKENEEILIKEYKEHKLCEVKYLLGDIEKYSDIDFLKKKKTYFEDSIKYMGESGKHTKNYISNKKCVFERVLKNFQDNLKKNPKYLDTLICNIKVKIEKIKNHCDEVSDIIQTTNGVFKKISSREHIKISQFNKIKNVLYCDSNLYIPDVKPLSTDVVDHIKNIGDIIKDTTLSKEIIKNNAILDEFEYEERYEESNEKKIKIKSTLANLQRHFSFVANINLYIDYYDYIMDNDLEYIHFFIFNDVRGRFYYNSLVPVHGNLIFRYLYNFGEYKIRKVPIIQNYIDENILQSLSDSGIHDLNAVNILYSIGALFKNKLKSNVFEVTYADILKKGLDVFLKNKSYDITKHMCLISEIRDIVVLRYYLNIIDLVLGGSMKIYPVIKDSIASFAQHKGVLCGFKEDSLKYLNFNNTKNICDTYTYILEELKKYLREHIKPHRFSSYLEIEVFLNRSLYKGIIMTINYSISYTSALENFIVLLSSLKNNYFSDDLTKNEYLKKTLLSFFGDIY